LPREIAMQEISATLHNGIASVYAVAFLRVLTHACYRLTAFLYFCPVMFIPEDGLVVCDHHKPCVCTLTFLHCTSHSISRVKATLIWNRCLEWTTKVSWNIW
jgi:hypothetical protein